ncbi:MAG: hypothetical protein NT055_10285 [Nitrospirae bacterium]|nr:hypothetical protein [Nitrospirota bacterium]
MSISQEYSIFTHSRPDQIGTPRLLPVQTSCLKLSAKETAQIPYFDYSIGIDE